MALLALVVIGLAGVLLWLKFEPTQINPLFGDRSSEGKGSFTFRMFGGADDSDRIGVSVVPRYDVFLLSPYHISIATKIKQINPSAVIYMYKDASSTRRDVGEPTSTWCNSGGDTVGHDWGVDYCDTDAHHPEWFLTIDGSRFEYDDYENHWHMDVGAAGYKERWATNVIEDLQSNSVWSGVVIDNQLSDITAYTPDGRFPDQYATVSAGQVAYDTFIDYVGTQIVSAGFDVIANMSDARLYPGLWDDYSEHQTGGYDEVWVTFGGTDANPNNLPVYEKGWQIQVEEAEGFDASGKMGIFSAQASGGECTVCARYGYASYLMVNNGEQTFMESSYDNDGADYQSTRPMYSWNLGDATSARTEIQGANSNLFQRTFSNGIVLVNADKSSNYVVNLPGTFLDENNSLVTSVSVDALRARILRTVSSDDNISSLVRNGSIYVVFAAVIILAVYVVQRLHRTTG